MSVCPDVRILLVFKSLPIMGEVPEGRRGSKKSPNSFWNPRIMVVFSLAVPSPRIFRLLTKTKSLYDSTVTVDVTVVEVVEECTTLCYELCQ